MTNQVNERPSRTGSGSLNAVEFLIMRGRNLAPTAELPGAQKTELKPVSVPVVLSRTSDPETSKRAAEKVSGFVSKHKAKVWGALNDFGPMNYKEIALKSGLRPDQVGRILHKMRHLIKAVGERDGCQVWEATC